MDISLLPVTKLNATEEEEFESNAGADPGFPVGGRGTSDTDASLWKCM